MIDLPARFLVWSRQLSCDIAEKRQAMKRMWPSVASLAKRQIGTWRTAPRGRQFPRIDTFYPIEPD